jgi:hypothetical protein
MGSSLLRAFVQMASVVFEPTDATALSEPVTASLQHIIYCTSEANNSLFGVAWSSEFTDIRGDYNAKTPINGGMSRM